ncbi:MAG TPA: hypothetical protein VD931_23105 [Baekduia sp.]|nr:hypothetical protein [Baekduia sp.]
MRRTCAALLVLLAALAATAAPAAAQDGGRLLAQMVQQLQREGKIDACDYSAAELKAAQKAIPPDVEQYAPDLPTAIDAAIQRRARGGCRKGGGSSGSSGQGSGAAPAAPSGGGTSTPGAAQGPTATGPSGPTTNAAPSAPGTTPAPAPGLQPSPAAADGAIPEAVDAAPASSTDAGDAPAPLILLLVLGAILLAFGSLAAAVRFWAWEPGWVVRARHAGAEAGWRTSAAWAEFSDWVRLGR